MQKMTQAGVGRSKELIDTLWNVNTVVQARDYMCIVN